MVICTFVTTVLSVRRLVRTLIMLLALFVYFCPEFLYREPSRPSRH